MVAGTERTARIYQTEMGFFVFRSLDLSCMLSAGHVGRGWVLFRILNRPL